MGMYKQLTQLQRYHIRLCLKAGYSLSSIARRLGVHKSTVSREIRRNSGHKGYRPRQAHEKAMTRRYAAAKRIKMTLAMKRLNNRPRKTLGFATPNEVFLKDINNKNNVALVN